MNFFLRSFLIIWIPGLVLYLLLIRFKEYIFFDVFMPPYTFMKVYFGSMILLHSFVIHAYLHFLKLLPAKLKKMNKSVFQKRGFNLHLSFDEAFKKCLDSCVVLEDFIITNNDISSGLIVAQAIDPNSPIAGEIVTFKLKRINENLSSVVCCSKPKTKVVLVDGFRSLIIVERILHYLEEFIYVKEQD